MKYRQNQKTLEIHRVDDEGRALEICNTDQIEAAEELEEADALRIVAANIERRCGHCWPGTEAPKGEAPEAT